MLGYRANGWAMRNVHGRSEKFISITTCRQSGKSVTAKMEIDFAMTQPADPLYGPPRVAIVGPEYSKAEAVAFAWYEMVTKVLGEGYAVKDVQRHTISIPATGAILRWLTSSNIASLVGETYSYLILDESQLIPDSAWNVLYPTTSVRSAPIRAFGTPDITPDQSWYRGLWLRGRPEENDPECHSYSVTCYENPWIPPEEIVRARATMGDAMFRMLYLAEWGSGDNQVFQRIENGYFPGGTQRFTPGMDYVMCVDPAITEDYWVVMLGEVSSGRAVAMERWHRMPLTDAYDRVQRFWDRYGRPRVFIDASSIGLPIMEEFRKRGMALSGLTIGANNKMEIIHRLAGAIEHGRIRFPDDWEDLIRELNTYMYVTTPSGKVGASAPSTYHDDCVMTLALMNEAFRYRPQYDSTHSGQYFAGDSARVDPRRPKSKIGWREYG